MAKIDPASMAILIGACVLSGCQPTGPARQVARGTEPVLKTFSVGFEQDGRAVPIVNGQARLRKDAFAVVISWPKWDGVMVNASTSDDLAHAVRAGNSVSSVAPIPNQAIKENLLNPHRQVVVSDKLYNYWYYFGQTQSRFDTMDDSDGRCTCKRYIANYRIEPDGPLMPLSRLDGQVLYMTFVKAGAPSTASGHRSQVEAYSVELVFDR